MNGQEENTFVGRVLNQKYRLIEQLAEGGMAVVYRAQHIFLDDICAVKIIKRSLSSKDEMLKRFQREAKLTRKVARRSPYIISIYDFGVEDGIGFYYAMELLDGYPFTELLQDPRKPPPARTMVRLLCQICDALGVVHEEGLIHRDIKPDNIFLHRDPNHQDEMVKLLDFGIARSTLTKATMLTNYGRVMGTPEYMSPEQCRGPTPEQYERGESHLDGRSDIYALGILLYQGLTGNVPFPMEEDGGPMAIHKVMAGHVMENPPSPLEKRADLFIPPALSAVTLKSIAKEPSDRFQSMYEFRDALLSCYPDLIPEFKGTSHAEQISSRHESPVPVPIEPPQLKTSTPNWEQTLPSPPEIDETPADIKSIELQSDNPELFLDRTAFDVQLPASLWAEVERLNEYQKKSSIDRANQPETQPKTTPNANSSASADPIESRYLPRSEPVASADISRSPQFSATEDWRSDHSPHDSSSVAMQGTGFDDLVKTVSSPLSLDMIRQLQEKAAEAIQKEQAQNRPPVSIDQVILDVNSINSLIPKLSTATEPFAMAKGDTKPSKEYRSRSSIFKGLKIFFSLIFLFAFAILIYHLFVHNLW
jgi:serine/threonine protein kinase